MMTSDSMVALAADVAGDWAQTPEWITAGAAAALAAAQIVPAHREVAALAAIAVVAWVRRRRGVRPQPLPATIAVGEPSPARRPPSPTPPPPPPTGHPVVIATDPPPPPMGPCWGDFGQPVPCGA